MERLLSINWYILYLKLINLLSDLVLTNTIIGQTKCQNNEARFLFFFFLVLIIPLYDIL